MTRFDFYHLQVTPLEKVLPTLAEKAFATGKRVKIMVGTEERVEFLNSLLWTYNEESFLPHGSKKDGFASEQPIFISSDENNENGAVFLILVDGAILNEEKLSDYERVMNVFDGTDEEALNKAREYWKKIKSLNGELHYWQQNEEGKFVQKV